MVESCVGWRKDLGLDRGRNLGWMKKGLGLMKEGRIELRKD